MNDSIRHKIYLAALLHDVGKFWQRADRHLGYGRWEQLNKDKYREDLFCPKYNNKYSHKHVLWTAQFIEEILGVAGGGNESLIRLAAMHHNPENDFLFNVISTADHLSSGMDRNKPTRDVEHEQDPGAYRKTPLLSVFEAIGRKLENPEEDWHYRMPVSILDADHLMPVKKEGMEDIEHQYAHLWKEFIDEISKLNKTYNWTNKNFAETLYYLFEKYMSNVPSSTQDIPDISLFDHSKTTAAFAMALYDYLTEKGINSIAGLENLRKDEANGQPFILLGADLSGIQKYLYHIKSKYAAKNLKGRSFMLHLLMTSIVSKLLDELDLYQSNMIYNSGGTFFMLLPNTEKVKRKVEEIFREIEKELFDKFRTQLYVAHGYVPFGMPTVFEKRINRVWEEVFREISLNKSRRFKDLMEKNYDTFFEPQAVDPEAVRDDITGDEIEGEPVFKEDMTLSWLTAQQIELGKKLKSAKYWFVIHGEEDEKADMHFAGYNHYLRAENDAQLNSVEQGIRYKFNDTSFLDEEYYSKLIQAFEFYGGNDYPVKDEEKKIPKTFDELTKGKYNKLGVVRMDVDNLGYIFSSGFAPGQKTFSRYASLSRNMDLFFRGYLNKIWERNPDYKEHVFILYSGGDDLFVLGDWDVVREFVEEVRRDFRKFVCENPFFTISSGELIVPPKYPILKSAQQAGEVEDLAKQYEHSGEILTYRFYDENDKEIEVPAKKQKDAFAMLDTALGWETEYEAVKLMAEKLYNKIANKDLPKSLLQKLMVYYERRNEPRTIWLISYDFGRMMGRYKNEKGFLEQILKDWIGNNTWEGCKVNFYNEVRRLYAVAARWAELLYRDKN